MSVGLEDWGPKEKPCYSPFCQLYQGPFSVLLMKVSSGLLPLLSLVPLEPFPVTTASGKLIDPHLLSSYTLCEVPDI